jgi:hypothetical protein
MEQYNFSEFNIRIKFGYKLVCNQFATTHYMTTYKTIHMYYKKSHDSLRKEFCYKLVCSQLTTTHYVSINKIIHVYFSHMTYLMSHVTSLNNTRG